MEEKKMAQQNSGGPRPSVIAARSWQKEVPVIGVRKLTIEGEQTTGTCSFAIKPGQAWLQNVQ